MKWEDNEFIIWLLARCKFTTQTPTHYTTDRKPAGGGCSVFVVPPCKMTMCVIDFTGLTMTGIFFKSRLLPFNVFGSPMHFISLLPTSNHKIWAFVGKQRRRKSFLRNGGWDCSRHLQPAGLQLCDTRDSKHQLWKVRRLGPLAAGPQNKFSWLLRYGLENKRAL